MTQEPDGNFSRLWLKFENAGELHDYSLYQDEVTKLRNKAYSRGDYNLPGLFNLYNNNNIIKYELFSYFNGNNHFAHVFDSDSYTIKGICINGSKDISIFSRFKPMSLGKQLSAQATTLFTKIDDDQLRYGYAATIDEKGHINFYIRNDFRQYHLWIKNAYTSLFSDPVYQERGSFRFDSFQEKSFKTNYGYLCSVVKNPSLYLDDWFFEYNKTTNEMTAILNGALRVSSSTFPTVQPILDVPLQDGKWVNTSIAQQTTVHDSSGNNYDGTITNLTTGGGVWNDDNTLSSNGLSTNSMQIDFGSIPEINTLTEFTLAFWFNPLDELTTSTTSRYILNKGIATANSFFVYRGVSSNDIRFALYQTGSGDLIQAIFPNAFPESNKWYFIVCKWKSGEKVKISVNNAPFIESSTSKTFTLTNSTNNLSLFRSISGAKGNIALLKVYNVQIDQSTQDDLYEMGYHNPCFPRSEAIQPVPEDDPTPIFIPYSVFYALDKQTTPVSGDYRYLNDIAGDNPYIEKYNCADGVEVNNPENLIYDVADGVESGGNPDPFVEKYNNQSSQTSHVELSDSNNAVVGAVYVNAGSNLIGFKITKATFYLKASGSPAGTLYCRVWNSSGTLIQTIGSMIANDVSSSDYTAYTFTNTGGASFTIAADWAIGIEYDAPDGSNDTIYVRRSSDAKPNEEQGYRDEGGSWHTNNSFDVAAILYSGGTGSDPTDPFVYMEFVEKPNDPNSNLEYYYDRILQKFGSGDPIISKIPTKVKFKVKRVGSATGTLRCYLRSSHTGTILAEFSNSINVSSIPLTTTEYTFTNLSNTNIINTNYNIMLFWENMSTIGKIGVLTNNGSNDPHPPAPTSNTISYIQKYGSRNFFGFWEDLQSFTSLDISGKIYEGGTSFDPWNRFTATKHHIGIKIVNINSILWNQKITRVTIRVRKVGTPTGLITCSIKRGSDFSNRIVIEAKDVTSILTTIGDFTFTNNTHNIFTEEDDRIAITYSGSDPSNYVEINVNTNIINGLNTITYQEDGAITTEKASEDMAGKIYTGGEPDVNSRTRVAQVIEHQDSFINRRKITKVVAQLIRSNTSTTGTVTCEIRDMNDQLIKTLASYSVGLLSTNPASPSEVTFEDVNNPNNYPMAVGDKVCIVFSGGSTTNRVGVLVRSVTPNYDSSGSINRSMIKKFDEVDYDDTEPNYDLVAYMYEGGFEYTPEPGEIPDPTPVNDKDLIIAAGNNKASGFFEVLMGEFRVYSKLVDTTEATYLYQNRYTLGNRSSNEILMPFTLKPVDA